MRIVVMLIVLIAASIGAFISGWHVAKQGAATSAQGMQTKLGFAHLQTYRRLEEDLASKCITRAESRVRHAIDLQKMLMAEYIQEYKDEALEEYINLRDEKLVGELLTYEVNWNKEWTEPNCSVSAEEKGDSEEKGD